MKKTADVVGEIHEAFKVLENNQKECKKRYKVLNEEFDALYHEIETDGKYNLYSGYLKITKFQKVMQERRIVKHELYLANQAIKNMRSLMVAVRIQANNMKRVEESNMKWRENFQITHDDVAI